MKVALVHEWLTVIGGSENVFKEIAALYPGADIYTLVARRETIETLGLQDHKVHTSFIQKLPFGKTKYRNYLPFFAFAIEQFDLSSYDLIISSSHAVAKGVLVNANQIHFCYCHSPVRYAWDLYHQYIKEAGLTKGLKGLFAKIVLHRMRIWDFISANRVDYFISNSDYIGRRIKRVYGRDSVTIYPNVATHDFELSTNREDYYFTCSRFVPYKKIDIIVQAFSKMPDKKLIVIGSGPDFNKVQKMASKNVELLGYKPFNELRNYMAKAKAFVFAAEEDFGIIPVEAQASGTPVIAYGKGGSLETVVDGKTGIFFNEQTADEIIKAVERFEQTEDNFDPIIISQHAQIFSTEMFKQKISAYISNVLASRN